MPKKQVRNLVRKNSGIPWPNRAELGFNVNSYKVQVDEQNEPMPPCQKLSEPFDLATFNEIHLFTIAQELIYSKLITLHTVRSEILCSFRIILEALPDNQ